MTAEASTETATERSRVQGNERLGPLLGIQRRPADSDPSTASLQPPRPDGYVMGKGPFSHGTCGRWWTGGHVGHCSGCHREFSRGAFDKHQRISHGKVTCSTDGLVAHEKPWGTLWTMPGGRWGGEGGGNDA